MPTEQGLSFSVIIPNHNGAAALGECLEAILEPGYPGLEVIVVDDASDDNSREIAGRFPVRTVLHRTCRGASAARNTGAAEAGGEILVFIDSDVVAPPETFRYLEENFRDPGLAGVVGLLRPFTRFENICSQYKNFYMHHTYRQLPEDIPAFYTSIAAIRRSVFAECGGFDESYLSASIEDTDFGVRVTGRGHRLRLDKRLQVDHIRRYNLAGLLKTGFRRASGISRIALGDRRKSKEKSSYLTTSSAFLAGIVLAGLAAVFIFLAVIFLQPLWLLPAAAAWLAIIFTNRSFLAGLARRRPVYLFSAGALILPDLLAHGAGAAWGAVSHLRGKKF